MKEGKSLKDLMEALQSNDYHNEDYIAKCQSIRMNTEGKIICQRHEYEPTNHAHGQIAGHLDIPVKYYRRMLDNDPALLADNVNTWLLKNDGSRMLRTNEGNLRAWLSDRYHRIDNYHVFCRALPVLNEQKNIQVVSADVTETRLYIKALFPDIQADVVTGDTVQAGVVISNSEIGMGSLQVSPLVYRLVCRNGMIAQDHNYRRAHIGRKIDEDEDLNLRDETKRLEDEVILMKLEDTITSAAETSFKALVKKMRAAAGTEVAERPVQAVKKLAKSASLGITDEEAEKVLENLLRNGDFTQWGMVNAVTGVANEHPDYERATEFEKLGGEVLELRRDDWKAIAEAA